MSMTDAERRRQIVELLEMLASADEQLTYERNVPHVDITAELVCMWFDDAFAGDPPEVSGAFTPAEHHALTAFHRFYDKRVDRLPESRGTVQTWLSSPVWREVMSEAQSTLDVIRSNQAMQRTAGRSDVELSMTSTLNPQPRASSPAVADLGSR